MKPLLRLFAGLVILAFVAPAAAAPALWEVRDEDSSIWLFGSIDNLPEGQRWRTRLFDDVLAKADKVVFEVDTGSEGTAASGAAALSRGIYTDGTLLTDLLDDQTELNLRHAADFAGVPVGVVLAMRPWFAAGVIHVGTQAAYGIADFSLASQLQSELPAQRLQFLQTVELEMSVLDSVSVEAQVELLVSTLRHLTAIPKTQGKLAANWAAGTPENVERAFLMEASGNSGALFETMVQSRNRDFMPQVESMLLGNEENLIVIGMSALIGDSGLLVLLADAGYVTERVQ